MTSAISLILPVIVSGTAFSFRRSNKGVNSNNIVEGTSNCIIAGGQSYKAFESSANLAQGLKESSFATKITGAKDYIKNLAAGDDVLKGFGKFFQFVGDNVNTFITIGEGFRVLFAEDKESQAIESAVALPMMFGFEKACKSFTGIAKMQRKNGVLTPLKQKGLYEDIKWVKNLVDKFTEYCSKNKFMGHSLEHLPSIGKGLTFVAASITGYKVGSWIGRKIAEKYKEWKGEKAKTVQMNTNYTSADNTPTAKTVSMQPQLLSYTNIRHSA